MKKMTAEKYNKKKKLYKPVDGNAFETTLLEALKTIAKE